MSEELPNVVEQMIADYPQVWQAYNQLGDAAATAGPLDEKAQRLVRLAIAIGAQKEGAVHSHARRALNLGASKEELLQIALLSITTLGWASAMAAVTWIHDITDRGEK